MSSKPIATLLANLKLLGFDINVHCRGISVNFDNSLFTPISRNNQKAFQAISYFLFKSIDRNRAVQAFCAVYPVKTHDQLFKFNQNVLSWLSDLKAEHKLNNCNLRKSLLTECKGEAIIQALTSLSIYSLGIQSTLKNEDILPFKDMNNQAIDYQIQQASSDFHEKETYQDSLKSHWKESASQIKKELPSPFPQAASSSKTRKSPYIPSTFIRREHDLEYTRVGLEKAVEKLNYQLRNQRKKQTDAHIQRERLRREEARILQEEHAKEKERKIEETRRKDEERVRAALTEAERRIEQERIEEEKRRFEQERIQEEECRIEHERVREEEYRIEQECIQEEERRKEEARIEEEYIKEVKRIKVERIEAERIEAERIEDEYRKRVESTEAARIEEDNKRESERMKEEERRIEAARVEEVRRNEAERIEKEERLHKEELGKQELERLKCEEEKRMEEKRLKKEEFERQKAEHLERERLELEEFARLEAAVYENARLEEEQLRKEEFEKQTSEQLEKERLEAAVYESVRLEKKNQDRIAAERLLRRDEEKHIEAELILKEHEKTEKLEAELLNSKAQEIVSAEHLQQQAESDQTEAVLMELERARHQEEEVNRREKEAIQAAKLRLRHGVADIEGIHEFRPKASKILGRKFKNTISSFYILPYVIPKVKSKCTDIHTPRAGSSQINIYHSNIENIPNSNQGHSPVISERKIASIYRNTSVQNPFTVMRDAEASRQNPFSSTRKLTPPKPPFLVNGSPYKFLQQLQERKEVPKQSNKDMSKVTTERRQSSPRTIQTPIHKEVSEKLQSPPRQVGSLTSSSTFSYKQNQCNMSKRSHKEVDEEDIPEQQQQSPKKRMISPRTYKSQISK